MFTKQFWIETLERAVKSAAQFGLAAFGATIFTSVDQVIPAAQLVALAMLSGLVLSALTSVASIAVGPKGSASLVQEVQPQEVPDE